MLDTIQAWDEVIFIGINQVYTSSLADGFFPFITNIQKTWGFKLFICLGLIFWIYKRRKKGLLQFLFLAVVVGATDLGTYHLIKVPVERARPHHIERLNSQLRVPYGPKSFSFPSNHASNTAALMTGLSFYFPVLKPGLILWAVCIAYSRVYVGVHFLIDVLVGLLLGWFLSFLTFKFMEKKFPGFTKS